MTSKSLQIPHNIVAIGEHVNRLVDNLMYIEFRHQSLRRSDQKPLPTNPQTIHDLLQRPTAMGQPHQDMLGWPLAQIHTRAVMSLEEHAQLRICLPSLTAINLPPSYKFWFYVDLVHLIEWAKTLDFFRSLNLADQRELICFSAFQIFNVTQSYFSYSKGSNRLTFPDGKFSVWSPREAGQDIIGPMIRLQMDITEYLLLKALVVCNPSCETISEGAQTILMKQREKLSKVLFEHCMKTSGRQRGPSRFGEIIALESIMLQKALKSKHLQALLVSLKLRPTRVVLWDEVSGVNH
ncbi:hypothetical protein PENTCL1PPCAC_15810, partial [Pristionchus entomophagus]